MPCARTWSLHLLAIPIDPAFLTTICISKGHIRPLCELSVEVFHHIFYILFFFLSFLKDFLYVKNTNMKRVTNFFLPVFHCIRMGFVMHKFCFCLFSFGLVFDVVGFVWFFCIVIVVSLFVHSIWFLVIVRILTLRYGGIHSCSLQIHSILLFYSSSICACFSCSIYVFVYLFAHRCHTVLNKLCWALLATVNPPSKLFYSFPSYACMFIFLIKIKLPDFMKNFIAIILNVCITIEEIRYLIVVEKS